MKHIFVHNRQANDKIVDFLCNVSIGTNGAIYQHLHTSEKIKLLHQPHFFTIFRNENAISNITICEREISLQEKKINSLYIRYFAFQSSFQANGIKNENKKNSVFEKYIKSLLETSNLNVDEPKFDSVIYWAYIDPENNRSLNMSERFNFEKIGSFKTFAFSRFFPKKSDSVFLYQNTEKEEILNKLNEYYKDYSFYSPVHLFENNNYFVYKNKEGKIIAGIQANKVHWKIKALPGFKGKIMVKLLPYIPFLRRIINPKRYSFLATEGFFCVKDEEWCLTEFFSGVLNLQKVNSLLFWVDEKDFHFNKLLKSIKLGLLQKIKSDNSIDILAKFNNFPALEKKAFFSTTKYISGFDTT